MQNEMTPQEKARHEATTIKGDIPTAEAIQTEREKWDEKGHLIDPDEVAKEKRFRELALGKVQPTRADYPSDEWADRYLGKGNDQLAPADPANETTLPDPVNLGTPSPNDQANTQMKEPESTDIPKTDSNPSGSLAGKFGSDKK